MSDGKPIVNQFTSLAQIPTRSAEFDAISEALKKRGMKFVGTTIIYAFMQAAGLVNDHLTAQGMLLLFKRLRLD